EEHPRRRAKAGVVVDDQDPGHMRILAQVPPSGHTVIRAPRRGAYRDAFAALDLRRRRAGAGRGSLSATGTSTTNVEPPPLRGSTQIRPCTRRTSSRQM